MRFSEFDFDVITSPEDASSRPAPKQETKPQKPAEPPAAEAKAPKS